MTPDSNATAEATCQECCAVFSYEPIFVNDVDLAKSGATHCQPCKDDIDAGAAREHKEHVMQQRREMVLKVLPPALRPKSVSPEHGTDQNHPDFNLAAWKLLDRWRPTRSTNWLGLIGPAGLCKTRCLGLLAERLIMQGNSLVWTSAFRLQDEASINLKSKNPLLKEGARQHLEDCKSAGWLILDDLNVWTKELEVALFGILNHRRENALPTAFTSNLHPIRFRSLISSVNPDAFIGRLLEGTSLFDFTPPDQPEIPCLS